MVLEIKAIIRLGPWILLKTLLSKISQVNNPIVIIIKITLPEFQILINSKFIKLNTQTERKIIPNLNLRIPLMKIIKVPQMRIPPTKFKTKFKTQPLQIRQFKNSKLMVIWIL